MVMVRRRTMMINQHRMNKRSTRTVEPQEAAIETFVRNSTKKGNKYKENGVSELTGARKSG
jgi:hypothetical protein